MTSRCDDCSYPSIDEKYCRDGDSVSKGPRLFGDGLCAPYECGCATGDERVVDGANHVGRHQGDEAFDVATAGCRQECLDYLQLAADLTGPLRVGRSETCSRPAGELLGRDGRGV
ncbi:Uncharacterised protein [Mycobacteroides abscessus]|nr:Uncharacterised protein [Mycobacteroides abscessus]